jgi:hypothetical protein
VREGSFRRNAAFDAATNGVPPPRARRRFPAPGLEIGRAPLSTGENAITAPPVDACGAGA